MAGPCLHWLSRRPAISQGGPVRWGDDLPALQAAFDVHDVMLAGLVRANFDRRKVILKVAVQGYRPPAMPSRAPANLSPTQWKGMS